MKKPIAIKNILDPAGDSKAHLAELHSGLRTRLAHFRKHRSQEDQATLAADFSRVLDAWGITEMELPDTLWTLRMRTWIFLVPILYFAVAVCLIQDVASFLALLLVGIPCLLGLVTTVWRLSILRNRRFLPLSRWLLSLVRFEGKRP